MLFGLGWFAGVLGNVAVAFDATAIAGAARRSRFLMPTDGLWRGVIYGLEPPLCPAAGQRPQRRGPERGQPVLRAGAPAVAFIAWTWSGCVLVLAAGIALFRRREL